MPSISPVLPSQMTGVTDRACVVRNDGSPPQLTYKLLLLPSLLTLIALDLCQLVLHSSRGVFSLSVPFFEELRAT